MRAVCSGAAEDQAAVVLGLTGFRPAVRLREIERLLPLLVRMMPVVPAQRDSSKVWPLYPDELYLWGPTTTEPNGSRLSCLAPLLVPNAWPVYPVLTIALSSSVPLSYCPPPYYMASVRPETRRLCGHQSIVNGTGRVGAVYLGIPHQTLPRATGNRVQPCRFET